MIFAIILLAAVLAFFLAGYFAFVRFIKRQPSGDSVKGKPLFDSAPPSFKKDRSWLNQMAPQDVCIHSEDGLKLHAQLVTGNDPECYVICCHGYRANSSANAAFAHLFNDLGLSVLLPDARAHGNSEGTYIGMGWPERRDIVCWIKYILDKEPAAKIVLFGVSMGGATVMNTVGEALPDNVLCAIEDCGYISPREIFEYQLTRLKLPHFLLYAATPFAGIFAKFSALSRRRTRESLRRCRIPILMIHGENDRFVPVNHLYESASACGSLAETVVIPEAKHAESILQDYNSYRSAVSCFVKRFI